MASAAIREPMIRSLIAIQGIAVPLRCSARAACSAAHQLLLWWAEITCHRNARLVWPVRRLLGDRIRSATVQARRAYKNDTGSTSIATRAPRETATFLNQFRRIG